MFYMIIKTISAWHPIVWIVSTMSIFAIRKIISHMSIVKYGEKTDAIQCATIKRLKRNIDGRMKIGGTKIFTSRVWGRHAPTRALRKLAGAWEVKFRMDHPPPEEKNHRLRSVVLLFCWRFAGWCGILSLVQQLGIYKEEYWWNCFYVRTFQV